MADPEKKEKLPFDQSVLEQEMERMRLHMQEAINQMNANLNFAFQSNTNQNFRFHGFSITNGSDGKPVVQEFGNTVQQTEPEKKSIEEAQPLVEVLNGKNTVVVIAEIPGVRENEVSLHYADSKLEIKVETESKKYLKQLAIPSPVDYSKKKISCKNGILEVILPKKTE